MKANPSKLGPEAASRWSAPEAQLQGRDERSTASPIVSMSLRLAIPRQVALQQRLLPLHQPTLFCYEWERRSRENQRTVNSGLTRCLSVGVHRNRCEPAAE
jgi:hypothetical protein